ncbi:MAG TPA: DUF4136 domain-containing protein [Pyrinomonadaceae bacterium]|nr:DUF4136 domain-containing protein [Pyrinomonadaceae bacterium]
MKFRLPFFFFLFVMVISIARAQDVSVGFDKGVDFSSFKTYSWTNGIPAKNPFIDQQIRDNIEQQLAAKGLRRVEKDSDLHVLYVSAVDTELQVVASRWVTTGNWMTPITSGFSVKSQMWDVETGTLVVCLSDASDKNLLWRGTAKTMLEERSKKQNALEALTEDARKGEKKIKRAVEKMFKQYPPGKSGG